MTKLFLPDVALVVADGVCHDLTREAVRDCLSAADFGEVWIASDRRILPESDAGWIKVEFPTLADADRFRWFGWADVVRHLSHILVIEWDSWIINPANWLPTFLNYDYIGAVWWWHKKLRIGNGGFSLRSTELMRYLVSHADEFPNKVHEDETLCRIYRPELETRGFRWADDKIARRFSFEREIATAVSPFGFHGIFNWFRVLRPERLRERMRLCNDYVRRSAAWREMFLEGALM